MPTSREYTSGLASCRVSTNAFAGRRVESPSVPWARMWWSFGHVRDQCCGQADRGQGEVDDRGLVRNGWAGWYGAAQSGLASLIRRAGVQRVEGWGGCSGGGTSACVTPHEVVAPDSDVYTSARGSSMCKQRVKSEERVRRWERYRLRGPSARGGKTHSTNWPSQQGSSGGDEGGRRRQPTSSAEPPAAPQAFSAPEHACDAAEQL